MAVAFDKPEIRAELLANGQVLSSGTWSPKIRIDGCEQSVTSEWESTCWFSDHDVDYLELEARLSSGWSLQRQFLLAREDQFLFVADIVLGDQIAEIEHRSMLPLNPSIRFAAAGETQEGFLTGRKRLALVLPLGLPEWRVTGRDGSLYAEEDSLVLSHATRARGLYAPLFIDLHRRRMRQTVTWRQLTVAEELSVVPPSAAVGYRVQAGLEQWLFYRSLTPPANRTVLGQNLSSECLIGRFLNDGDVETLLEIE